MNKKKSFLTFIICVAILGAGIGIMSFLIKNRKVPKTNIPEFKGILVKTKNISPKSYQTKVMLTGVVDVLDQVEISSEVSGKIIRVNSNVDKGYFVSKGSLLFEIDPFNYRIAVQMAKSSYAKSESDLEQILSQSENAKKEWKRFHGEEGPPNRLVYMIPQVNAAKANMNARKAELEKAENDLLKTKVYSPCDGYILSENVSIGLYVNPGATLIKMIPSDKRDIIASVPDEDLAFLIDNKGKFITKKAKVMLRNLGMTFDAEIVRLLPEVDYKSRMYNILIRVTDLKNNLLYLSDKTFVHVFVAGKVVDSTVEIPLVALRGKNRVWLMDKDGNLRIQEVDLIEIDQDKAIVQWKVSDGEKLVVSHINGAVDGMKLREF